MSFGCMYTAWGDLVCPEGVAPPDHVGNGFDSPFDTQTGNDNIDLSRVGNPRPATQREVKALVSPEWIGGDTVEGFANVWPTYIDNEAKQNACKERTAQAQGGPIGHSKLDERTLPIR